MGAKDAFHLAYSIVRYNRHVEYSKQYNDYSITSFDDNRAINDEWWRVPVRFMIAALLLEVYIYNPDGDWKQSGRIKGMQQNDK